LVPVTSFIHHHIIVHIPRHGFLRYPRLDPPTDLFLFACTLYHRPSRSNDLLYPHVLTLARERLMAGVPELQCCTEITSVPDYLAIDQGKRILIQASRHDPDAGLRGACGSLYL